jgi:DNA-binding Lrp family transcriptional regulator
MTTASTSSKKFKLDKIDRRILHDLQTNGRMTNVELANNAGISAPPCLRRVRALEDNEVIKGYFARLNGSKLGYTVTAFVSVRLKNQNDSDLKAFENDIQSMDNIREAYIISGDFDLLLRVVAKDWEDYQDFLSNKLTTMNNVESVRTSMKVKIAKFEPGFPIDD